MESATGMSTKADVSAAESEKAQSPDPGTLDSKDRTDESVGLTQRGQMVYPDAEGIGTEYEDQETKEPLPNPTEKAEVVVRRKVKVGVTSNVGSERGSPVPTERQPSSGTVVTSRFQSDQQQTGLKSENFPCPSTSADMRSLEMIAFGMIEQRSRPVRAEYSSMPVSKTHFDHILAHANEAKQSVGFLKTFLQARVMYYQSKEDVPELEITKKKLHMTKISELYEEFKVFNAKVETTLDSIWRSTTESESNHVSSTNTASCKDDTMIASPNLEATENRGIPDGHQLNPRPSTAENSVSTHGQVQNEVKSENDAEDSAAASTLKQEVSHASPPLHHFLPRQCQAGRTIQNKQPTVDQNIVAEVHESEPKLCQNQESEQSSLLEAAGSSGGADRDDTSTVVPLNGEMSIIGGSSSDIEQDVTVENANGMESNHMSAADSMPCSNGLGLHVHAINEAIRNYGHKTPGTREQLLFHADLPPQQTAVLPEGDHDGLADRNPCRDTDPWIRRKGSSKSASKKSYNELHFGQPPGSREKKDKKENQENKVDDPTEIDKHPNGIEHTDKSVEIGTNASQAGPSTEEEQELEGAVGGMIQPSQHAKENMIIVDDTNRPGTNDKPVGKVQGVQRCHFTNELVSELQGEYQEDVLITPESGPPALLQLQGEDHPRLPTFDDPVDAQLYLPQEEELRAVRDSLRDEQPHGLYNNHQSSPLEAAGVVSRRTDTAGPGPSRHNTSLKQDGGRPEGRVTERSVSAMRQAFERGRTMSFRGRAGKKNQAADRTSTDRCCSCPPVCFVQPYKDQEDPPSSSNSSSIDLDLQGGNNRVAETRQENNHQEPRITVLDNAQQVLGVIRTSPTPVEQIAFSIRGRVFQELVLTGFTLGYPGGDIIPQGTMLGDQDATVLVFPAESAQPGQWRVVNNM